MSTATADLTTTVEQVIAAYNAQDWNTYEAFFTEDLYFCYHNHGVELTSRRLLIDMLRTYAVELMPDRRLGAATRLLQVGNIVVREQPWTGTAIADAPGLASAGQTVAKDFCTIYVFDEDRIREYHDYG